MTDLEKQALADTLGKQTSDSISKAIKPFEEKLEALEKEAKENKGGITEATLAEYKTELQASVEDVREIAKNQGITIQQLQMKTLGADIDKTFIQSMDEHRESIEKAGRPGNEEVNFMVYSTDKGELKAVRWDVSKKRAWGASKAAGPHATIGGVAGAAGAGGNVSSITQVFNAATILRMGADAPIEGQYRNNPWLFNEITVTSGGFDNRYANWIEEQISDPAGSGASVVAEGTQKPWTQYKATMRSTEYKKHAHLMEFTEEFVMDFERLYNYFLSVGRIDLMNKINESIVTDLIAIATPYSAGMATAFKNGIIVPDVNDYDALVALATQANDVTFGASANGALMSNQKAGRMSITKNLQGDYLEAPSYLDNVRMVGNPGITGDNVVLGDLKQYNLLLRGGMLVAIGLNGNNFAENKFTVRQEQYYFNYISELRKAAILKGPTFAAVKTLISTP